MKIDKLRLKGFIGILKGAGLPEIEIDFTGRHGLIAFAGNNGMGKTVCLESLSPFNQFISRDGALSHHCYLRDSERELSFEYGGNHYRTLLKMDALSGKSEGFIWCNGESIVNGKIREYSKKINELFGSANLFYNSVFCGQNATKMSDMTTGELKTLFAEFLRLYRLQEYEDTSKQLVNVLNGKAGQIDINISVLRKKIEGVVAVKEEIARLVGQEGEQAALKNNLAQKLAAARTTHEQLKEAAARNEVLQKQSKELLEMIRAMEKNRDDEQRQAGVQLDKLREQCRQCQRDIEEADSVMASEASILASVNNKKELEELIEAITVNLENIAEATVVTQALITSIEKDIAELKNKVVPPEKDTEYQKLNMVIVSTQHEISRLEGQLKALEIRDPQCSSVSCSFIVGALKASEDLPVLKEKLRQLENKKQQRGNELITAAAGIGQAVQEIEAALKESRARLNKLTEIQKAKRQILASKRMELAQYQNIADKQAALAVAKAKKEDRIRSLGEHNKHGEMIAGNWATKKASFDKQIEEYQEKHNALLQIMDHEVATKLSVIGAEIDRVSNELGVVEKTILDISARIARLNGELSGIQDAERELENANKEKGRIATNVAEWTYIKNACGKNGLQAMEIDATAPLISSFANDLLIRAFGPLFTVKLLTQDEDGKECLNIIVIRDDGEETNLDDLSGGEKVWLLMALRLAMTLLSKEKSGNNFMTAYSDESDGSLDADNAINYISMYRSFMEVGGFKDFCFISHRIECRHMADHVLNFEKGKIPYWN